MNKLPKVAIVWQANIFAIKSSRAKKAAEGRLDSLLLEDLESGESIKVTDDWCQEKHDYLI